MEIEIKPVTDEIRFATVLSQITDSIDSTISNASALLMDDGNGAPGQVASKAKRIMAAGHLWWIVPITLLTGAWIGVAIYADKQKKKNSRGNDSISA